MGPQMLAPLPGKKIQQVVDELGFSPDKQARGLAASRSYLIGLIYDNPDALYIDQVQRGVLDVCSKKRLRAGCSSL